MMAAAEQSEADDHRAEPDEHAEDRNQRQHPQDGEAGQEGEDPSAAAA